MAKLVVREDVTPKYMEAAGRMFGRLGIDAGRLEKPEDVREALMKAVKKPDVKNFRETDVVRDNGEPHLAFHKDGGITIFGKDGQRSFLFVWEGGAGFLELGPGGEPAYTYYSEANWSVEAKGTRLVREIDGEKTVLRLDHEEGEPDEWWTNANAVLEKRVGAQEAEAYRAMSLTGLRQK